MASEAARLGVLVLGAVALEVEELETPVTSLDGPTAAMSVESEPLAIGARTGSEDTDGPATVKLVDWTTGAGFVIWSTGAGTTAGTPDETVTTSVVGADTVTDSTVVVTGAAVVEAG